MHDNRIALVLECSKYLILFQSVLKRLDETETSTQIETIMTVAIIAPVLPGAVIAATALRVPCRQLRDALRRLCYCGRRSRGIKLADRRKADDLLQMSEGGGTELTAVRAKADAGTKAA